MDKKVLETKFIKSSQKLSECPKTHLPEMAFVGRSNVGKSSLINMITGKKGLAKTSSTPGKTQLINHFLIDESWFLVDLPGYGYAKVSKEDRKKFKGMMYDYLEKRSNLYCVFVLIDSRHDPQKLDLDFMEWLAVKQVPFVMTFTKSDKLNNAQFDNFQSNYNKKMLAQWEELPQQFVSSSVKSTGREELIRFISSLLNNH